ncbi:MAG: cysteine desulfurase family protein, partial [Pirellulales bacterium]
MQMPSDLIYLDNQATTRVDPRVVEAMLPWMTEHYGNPGSTSHRMGNEARDGVERAAASIATNLGCSPRELVFTSGATESNNLAIRGIAESSRRRGDHIVSVVTEHRAVLDPIRRLGRRGFEVTWLPVAPNGSAAAGRVDLDQLRDAIRDDTCLVSVMMANNEIGTIQPIAEIGRVCHQRGVPLHCDAAQAVGKLPVDVEESHVDLLSFSAHKFYGPRGIGGLYVRRRNPTVRLMSQIDGGGQQRGLRSGTLNTPGIVGMAHALELCAAEQPQAAARLRHLRDRLFHAITRAVDDVTLNGPTLPDRDLLTPYRLPGNLNLCFRYVEGEALMLS